MLQELSYTKYLKSIFNEMVKVAIVTVYVIIILIFQNPGRW